MLAKGRGAGCRPLSRSRFVGRRLDPWPQAVWAGGGADQGAVMGSDWDSAAGSAFGAELGRGLVIGQLREVERRVVQAATAGLTQGEKLLLVAPTRSAG